MKGSEAFTQALDCAAEAHPVLYKKESRLVKPGLELLRRKELI